MTKIRLLLLAASAIAPIAAVQAQDEPAARNASGVDAASDEGATDEIIVTARRRDESILDVPVAVTALSGAALRDANISGLSEIARLTPSLRIAPVAGRYDVLNFSIRGMNDSGGLITSDPTVGVYFADAIQTRPQGAGRALYDIASIQVLKGPQGTLFGRNLTGGAVLIQPVAPDPDSIGGYVQAVYGSYDRTDLQGAINLPIADGIALRVAGNLTRRDGYIRNLTTGALLHDDHSDSFRASLLVVPTENIRNTIIVDYYKGHRFGGGFTPEVLNPAVDTTVNPYAGRLAVFNRARLRSIYVVEETTNSPTSSSNLGVTNTTELMLGENLSLKNIFNYRRVRSDDSTDDAFPQDFNRVRSLVRAHQYSEELQLIGSALDSRLNFIAGAYYFREEGRQRGLVSTLGGAARITDGDATSISKSLFAQLDYSLTGKLSVTAGIRNTWDTRRLHQIVVLPTGVQSIDAQREIGFSKPSWTLSASYKPNDDTLIYLSNRRGYRSGGFNAGATTLGALEPIQPETLTDYELGFKAAGRSGDLRFRFSSAVFYSKFTDVQRGLVALTGTPPAPTRVILNAADATVKGGEAELNLDFARRLEISGSVGYTDASYTNFIDPVTGADLSDRRFAQTPKWTYRLGAKYHVSDTEIGDLTFGADWSYQSSFVFEEAKLPGHLKPGYGLLSARISASDLFGTGLRTALFATNLLDKKYAVGGSPLWDAPFGYVTLIPGEPRMYGIEVGFDF